MLFRKITERILFILMLVPKLKKIFRSIGKLLLKSSSRLEKLKQSGGQAKCAACLPDGAAAPRAPCELPSQRRLLRPSIAGWGLG